MCSSIPVYQSEAHVRGLTLPNGLHCKLAISCRKVMPDLPFLIAQCTLCQDSCWLGPATWGSLAAGHACHTCSSPHCAQLADERCGSVSL